MKSVSNGTPSRYSYRSTPALSTQGARSYISGRHMRCLPCYRTTPKRGDKTTRITDDAPMNVFNLKEHQHDQSSGFNSSG